uniref:Cytochrome b n=1 Tax=Raeta sp. TaxID=3067663 RepID=A0AA50AGW1_9BIVA|nr:cytochrome b [Raeta sp.]
MKVSLRKSNPALKIVAGSVYDLPTPPNLSAMWNFGSLLGLCWVIQVLTGLMLACQYCASADLAFDSVVHIMRDVNYGWLMRSTHCNGASAFFLCVYIHIGRGIYYHSFFLKHTWWVGCSMLLLLMGVAFSGYVLPWGQMSYWGATVILNLASAIPFVGSELVEWIWGGFSVGDPTLKRLFVFHFLSPFALGGLAVVHLIYLHETGSGNPLGIDASGDAIPFHSSYSLKDLLGFVVFFFIFFYVVLRFPDFFGDPINFSPANPLKTPQHIQPEWYFLFAYAILRSVPNKLGGVVGLVASVAILYLMPLFPQSKFVGIQDNPISQVLFWMFIGNFFLLSYIGACPVEDPYFMVGVSSSIFFFMFFLLYPVSYCFWDTFYSGVLTKGSSVKLV